MTPVPANIGDDHLGCAGGSKIQVATGRNQRRAAATAPATANSERFIPHAAAATPAAAVVAATTTAAASSASTFETDAAAASAKAARSEFTRAAVVVLFSAVA